MSIIIRDGEVLVKVPTYVNQATVDSFVQSKKDWIQSKLDVYEKPGVHLEEKTMRVFGNTVDIIIVEGLPFSVYYDESIIKIIKPASMSTDLCQRKVEDFLKDELIDHVNVFTPYYAQLLQLKTPPFKVRRYKRIHGRCSQKGELAFNTYLFHESIDFIKYVVLHECAHLIEFNHSSRFYDLIMRHMPHYKEIIASSKLRDNLHPDQ